MRCGRPGCGGTLQDLGGGTVRCAGCGLEPEPGALPPDPAASLHRVGGPSGSAACGPDARRAAAPASDTAVAATEGFATAALGGAGFATAALGGAAAPRRPVPVRGSRSGSGGSGRGRLGGGLVSVPPIPRPDPRHAVLKDPHVPERKRFCGRCDAPVGRTRGDRPGRTEGYCTQCGNHYSFSPKLRPGDVVHGQYEVAGCLAHGGLGWVYLAVDRAVSDRWVVLKGLLDTGDQDAVAAAVAERRFLAEIEHPNIVRIYNFVEHFDRRTGSLHGYIVMEYVGGKSLKEIAAEHRRADGQRVPLPVAQAIAYGIEALEALGHLHSRNLLYCDFKVDNAIQQEDRLKLIDMGAVRRMDDAHSPVFGTIGYQAPEVGGTGPSVASDLYTVARTLAVLTFDFQGYASVFADSLPAPRHIEVFSRYPSFHRLLLRATDPDPGQRFASAEEMGEQLTGVLREVVALDSGQPRPALSTLFGPEVRTVETELPAGNHGEVSALGPLRPPHRATGRRLARRGRAATAGGPPPSASPYPARRDAVPAAPLPAAPPGVAGPLDTRAAALALPVPRIDPSDANAGYLESLASTGAAELLAALAAVPADSQEARLHELRACLELGDRQAAQRALAAADHRRPDDWRVVWYRGIWHLAEGDPATAAAAFEAVCGAFPGEPAPKLALGVCAEATARWDSAADYYGLVWRTDRSYVSAAFGLARVGLATGDRGAAVRALESVPESSIHYIAARVAAVRARLRSRSPDEPMLGDLRAAAAQVERLTSLGLDSERRETLTTEVLGRALDWVLAGRSGAPPDTVPHTALLGNDMNEHGLRLGLERSYRVLARLARSGGERIELVERANRFRPRTWV